MTAAGLTAAPVLLDGSCLTRRVMVTPGMCGGRSLFHSRLGDWTWETVAATSGTNVFDARTGDGRPAYLSFYYFHVRGSATTHPHGFTFGDELDVTSRSFDFGSESVLTLHRLSRAGEDDGSELLDPVEFYERPRPDRLYVQNLNRWISRGGGGGNSGLERCSPAGFRHAHLPALPSAYSPRGDASLARRNGTFHPGGVPGYTQAEPAYTTTYRLDVVHDLNGVGLVYFASYFSIIDGALLGLWRTLGRSEQGFLARKVVDQRIGYFGNADIDTVLTLTVRLYRSASVPGDEIADVAIHESATGRLLAVAALNILVEEP